MNIYNEIGFLNVPGIEKACPLANFFFVIGARQVGKTYGVLDWFHEQQYKYIFMRLTKEEIQYTVGPKLNMYKEKGFPWAEHMTIGDGKPLFIYDDEYSENEPVAMALALGDVAKIRGFGAASYTHIVLDEFIPEISAYQRKGQGFALKNAYTTINGIRDTPQGGNKPAVKCWFLANSNDLTSDILAEFHITQNVLLMMKKHQHFAYYPERGICIVLVSDSPVSAEMQRGALAKCIGQEDDFTRMAYENVFINDDDTGVKSCPIREYICMCSVDNLTFYRHKSRQEWYVVQDGGRAKTRYNSSNPTSYNAFLKAWKYQGLVSPIDGETIFYNCYTAKIAAYKILKLG